MSKYITNYARDGLLISLVKTNPLLYDPNAIGCVNANPNTSSSGETETESFSFSVKTKDEIWLEIAQEIDQKYPASMYELSTIEEKGA